MAVNPITSESLTVDYKSLMKIPIADRVKAATSVDTFAQSILTALTPIEIAKAFPDYYRRQLPDISNFLAASRYLDGGGTPHQTGGGEQGYTPAGKYDGETKPKGKRPAGTPEPTIAEMKKKLLEKGIDVAGAYNAVKQGPILEGDNRFSYLKKMSNEDLKKAGLERTEDENGKTLITAIPIQVPENLSEVGKLGSVGSGMDLPVQRRKELVYNAVLQQLKADGYVAKDIKGVAALLAGQPEQESGYNPTATHDSDKYGNPTGYGIYGARLDRRDKMFAWLTANGYSKDDLVGQARYMAHEAVTDYKDVLGKVSDLDLTTMAKEDPGQFRKVMLDFVGGPGDRGFESPAFPESGLENRIRGATDTFNMKEENIFAVDPEQYKETQQQIREDALIRTLYDQASPTSSEYVVDPTDPRTYTMIPVGGTMTGKSMLSDEDVPFSGGSQGSRSFGGPRGTNQLHTGVDIPGKAGDPVLAVDNGTIVDMRKSPSGYGYTLDIQYPDGTVHRMAHLGTNDGGWKSAFAEDLKVGDTITAGQQIGTLGYSGNAGPEFPHVHYEVIRQDYYEKTKGRPPGRISGRTDASMKELERGRIDPREWYRQRQEEQEKLKKDAATTPPPIPEQKAAEVQATSTSEPAPSVPAEEPKLALGGNLYGLNEDLTLVDNETGEAVAQVGKNEKLVKQGTTMQVTSTDRLKAEELSQKYDTNEMETRLENIENDVEDYRTQQMQKRDVPRPAAPTAAPVDNSWRESLAMRHYDESPSYRRAMNRVRGRPETGPNQYDHFTKATIASKV